MPNRREYELETNILTRGNPKAIIETRYWFGQHEAVVPEQAKDGRVWRTSIERIPTDEPHHLEETTTAN